MPQDEQEQAKEASVTFKAKAGLPSDPKEMEVHAGEGDLKPWDLDSLPKFEQVGKDHTRLDGPLKVTGQAKYTYDVKLPGMLYGRMVGASIPAGVIIGIDTSKAEALPGVKAVWTAEAKKVRFAGQDVAAVAAVSPEIAEDAARLVEVTYEEKPFVHELRAAMEDGAPAVFAEDEAPVGEDQKLRGNIVGPGKGGRGNVAAGFAEAAVDRGGHLLRARSTPTAPSRPTASWPTGRATSSRCTPRPRGSTRCARASPRLSSIDRKNVRVICEHMGGGFGSKLGPSATGSAFAVAACKLAKKAGAPVKLMLDRQQEHLCTGNAPSAQITVKIGAKKDGTLTAVEYTSYGSAGVAGGAGTAGPVNSLYGNNPNLKVEEYDVFTNAGPAAPLRAPGHSQGAFAVESAMDELAEKLGMDPLELRKKNESSPIRAAQYDPGAKAIGWERRNKKAGDTPGPKKRGIGMANGNWYVFAAANVSAQVKIHRDGSVELFSGAQDIGTGYRTMIAVVAAEELGIAPTDITSRVGDTQFPEGPASGGSITTNSMAPVVRLAANDARTKLFEVAATALGVAAGELDVGGRQDLRGGRPEPLAHLQGGRGEDARRGHRLHGQAQEAVRDLPRRHRGHAVRRGRGRHRDRRGAGPQDGLGERLRLPGEHPDREEPGHRGHDPGGLLGASRGPHPRPHGRHDGQPQPRGVQDPLPDGHVRGGVDPRPQANLGNNTSTAGIGEPPIVPTLGAIANAVYNATGARVRELPITPDRVLAALAEAKGRA